MLKFHLLLDARLNEKFPQILRESDSSTIFRNLNSVPFVQICCGYSPQPRIVIPEVSFYHFVPAALIGMDGFTKGVQAEISPPARREPHADRMPINNMQTTKKH